MGEAGIHTTKSVGIGTTARSDFKLYVSTGSTADTVAYFDGNISIAGSTFSREVVEIESLGIITATKGVDVISGGVDITAGGLNVTAGVSTFSGIGTFGNSVFIDGDLRCVGVATFGSSSITIDGSNNVVNVGTGITIDAAAQTITVGTSKIADPTGDANYAGVVTATTFDGNLATTNLTGTITNAQLAGSIANDKLAGSIANDKLSNSSVSYGGVSLSLGGSDGTPAFDLSDATNYPTSSLSGTITNAQLAGSIANDKLANSTVSLGGISIALGETDATPAFNLSDATNYPFTSVSYTHLTLPTKA